MRVRRAGTVVGTVTALVLLGGPSWADTPSPEPSAVATDGTLDPAGNPDCHFVAASTDTPTDQPTDVATDVPTDQPTDVATDTPTDQPTDVPTDQPTDVPTDQPTDVATDTPTDVPTDQPTDVATDVPTDDPGAGSGGYWVCLAATESGGDATMGSGTVAVPQLPFSGAPLAALVTLGAGLVAVGGAALVAGRRRLG